MRPIVRHFFAAFGLTGSVTIDTIHAHRRGVAQQGRPSDKGRHGRAHQFATTLFQKAKIVYIRVAGKDACRHVASRRQGIHIGLRRGHVARTRRNGQTTAWFQMGKHGIGHIVWIDFFKTQFLPDAYHFAQKVAKVLCE